ncbi:KR domain-containing protein [Amycolatopsis aidingensis]|uniref:KR domain-containing protein n=1 Tax=Amycolatopsis aidingensis TaxID=2842453 RepID=UPI001C0B0564|nr:KR domain-containing protein [Amycolatopsis aidingensis]
MTEGAASGASRNGHPEPGEPIAVIGAGCRMPGEVTGFDAGFFGISASEARALDPWHGVLLEAVWSALEHAGIPPRALRGSETGVFVVAGPGAVELLAGRFDLRGPCARVDQGRAPEAVHRAAWSLRRGECALAVACAVVPGNGCGVLVLERLDRARADGDRTLAVLGAGGSAEGPLEAVLALREGRVPAGYGGPGAAMPRPRPGFSAGREHVFALSAHTEQALRRRARDLVRWLETPAGRAVEACDLAAALAVRREHLDLRATVVAAGRGGLASGLRAISIGATAAQVCRGRGEGAGGAVFVFSGSGSQWPGMGRRLLTGEPAFRAEVEALEPVFLGTAGFSLRKQLRQAGKQAGAERSGMVLFGMQLALAGLWRAHGVEPVAVLGHGAGEIAAAVLAGALEIPDGLALLGSGARQVLPGPPRLACYSGMPGDPDPVPLRAALATAMSEGHRVFLEVSPHPIALAAVRATAVEEGVPGISALPSMSRYAGRREEFVASLAALHAAGHATVLGRRYPDAPVLDLPEPPWPPTAAGPAVPSQAEPAGDGTVFELGWERVPSSEPPPGPSRTWLLLPDDSSTALKQSFMVAAGLALRGDRGYALPQDDAEELPAVLAELSTDRSSPLAGVVLFAGSLAEYRFPELAQHLLLTVTEVVRRVTELGGTLPRLWLVTAHGTAVLDGEPGEPGLAFLRGLVRVLAFEHPGLHATMVDLDGLTGTGALPAELRAGRADDEVAWRRGERFVARLRGVTLPARRGPVAGAGAYVITGGLGRLGPLLATWLAEQGASRIVLCGRGGAGAEARAALAGLRAAGTEIELVRGDIAAPGVAEAVVAAATAGGLTLRGVAHAAGVLDDRALIEVDGADLARAWRPKVLGGWRLHKATEGFELDWWLAFSATTALFGAPGRVADAAANAWLDALVRWRRANGLTGTTVNWGAWDTGPGQRADPLAEPMAPAQCLAALSAVLAGDRPATAVACVDLPGALRTFPGLARRPFLEALAREGRPDPLYLPSV